MKLVRFDSIGGASGDMILGALFDLGVTPKRITEPLRRMLDEPFEIESNKFASHGLNGTRVTVKAAGHHHGSGHHNHADHDHDHEHRTFAGIRSMISASELPETVKRSAIAAFARVAQAEGKIHGKPADSVHFHEVGALDSIVDTVGSCLALACLDITGVRVGPLPLGRGVINCRHGIYPCPAPATAEILRGLPVVQTDEPHELVTPTGAALLASWAENLPAPSEGRVMRAGYGFGSRQLESRPNVLRALLLETGNTEVADETGCCLIETTLDDANPELLGILAGELLEQGALDAFMTPIQMKKQRPGTLLTVLCRPADRERLAETIFAGSTTIGLRYRFDQRICLQRREETVPTPYGEIRVKTGLFHGRPVTRSPEIEDCRKLAGSNGVTVRQVYEAAAAAAWRK